MLKNEVSGNMFYLQETVISIFVAGTVELSGSKSPIVAMAEGFPALFCFFKITSSKSLKFSLILAYSINSPVAIMCFFHPPGTDRQKESAGSGGCSCCC